MQKLKNMFPSPPLVSVVPRCVERERRRRLLPLLHPTSVNSSGRIFRGHCQTTTLSFISL